MRSVWKFEVPFTDEFDVAMPTDAQIISFDNQGEKAFIWAIVETEAESGPRSFCLRGTGHPVPYAAEYVGSAQFHGRSLVFHLFER